MTDDRREWYIYVLRDPRNDEVRYVGFTIDVQKRWRKHISESARGVINTYKARWIRSLLLLDLQPVIEVVDHGIGGDWQSVEKYWILHHRMQSAKLTNSTDGGDGMVGHKMSFESIEKMRQASLGRKKSPEHIERMTGRKKSPEEIEKMRQALLGRKLSPEHVENMRQASKKHTVRRVEDGMIFASVSEAARSVDRCPSNIHSAITTRGKCAGYHWERVGETPPAGPYTLDGNALVMRID